MKKFVTTAALVGSLAGIYGLTQTMTLPVAEAAVGSISAFLSHPHHCADLLGKDRAGDIPPPEFHAALGAALEASSQPPGPAIQALSRQCRQRLG